MKRDPRLHGLSSDHHDALVLARRLERAAAAGEVNHALVADLRGRFEAGLAPHFAVEEATLLPALRRAGLDALAARTEGEHAALRAHLEGAERGDLAAVGAFAALLAGHVHFEERELFPACEAHLDPGALDEVERLAPRKSGAAQEGDR